MPKGHANILLVTEGLDGIEARGARGRIEAGGEANENGEEDAEQNEPPRNRRNVHAGKVLAMQIEIGAESKSSADEPAENCSENAAEKTHYASFDEEKVHDVAVGSAEGFEDADFAAALEDGHDESVDNAKSSDGKSETAENAEKKIEHGEKDAQALGSVEKRKRAETEVLELGFRSFHQRGAFHANSEAGIGGLVAGRIAKNVAEVVDLRGAESFGKGKRDE